MTESRSNLSFISSFFEDFYYEILRQKERVLSNKWRVSLLTLTPPPSKRKKEALAEPREPTFDATSQTDLSQDFASEKYKDPDVENLLSGFQTMLEAQSLKANQEGGAFGVACYREAQYIMVVLADEIFLSLPWEGRKYWETHLLEERMFSSHVAGERFFTFLDDFLKERNPLKQELGILYLSALGLGFRGKYRTFDDNGAIDLYRDQLFTFIYHQSPSLFKSKTQLFPQASKYTLEGAPEHQTQDFRKWNLIFLSIFLSYLILSYTVWYGTTYQLDYLTTAILKDLLQLR